MEKYFPKIQANEQNRQISHLICWEISFYSNSKPTSKRFVPEFQSQLEITKKCHFQGYFSSDFKSEKALERKIAAVWEKWLKYVI